MDFGKKSGYSLKKRTNNTGGRTKSAKEKPKRKIFEIFNNSKKVPRSSLSILHDLIRYDQTSVSSHPPAPQGDMDVLSSTGRATDNSSHKNNLSTTTTTINFDTCIDDNDRPKDIIPSDTGFRQDNDEELLRVKIQNSKLQKIMSKLVTEHRKQKQRETWNNYINQLKNKHGYYSHEPNTIVPQYVPNNPSEMFDDQNDRYQTCQQLMNDLYQTCQKKEVPPNQYYECPADVYDAFTYSQTYIPSTSYYLPYMEYMSPEYYCYPTSSTRLMMYNKAKESEDLFFIPSLGQGFLDQGELECLKYCGFPVFDDGIHDRLGQAKQSNAELNKIKVKGTVNASTEVQTEIEIKPSRDSQRTILEESESFKEKPEPDQSSTGIFEVPTNPLSETTGVKYFKSIETKIDSLITSINSFKIELRSSFEKRLAPTESRSVLCKLKHMSNMIINSNQSNNFKLNKMDSTSLPTNIIKSKTSVQLLSDISMNRIDEIIEEEKIKSNKIKQDIEKLLHSERKKRNSMQMTFEIPTRERSIAVTSSLLKVPAQPSKRDISHEIVKPQASPGDSVELETGNEPMTMAVNTDPLGILALLQVSSETIKQLVLQSLDYSSYLPMLSLPMTCETHCICEVCGLTVNNLSQLNEHERYHTSVKTRDSRTEHAHTLEEQRDALSLFSCKYCGEKFIRAYCYELHQKACGRRAREPIIANSLTILR